MRFLLGFEKGDFGAGARFKAWGTDRRQLCAGMLRCEGSNGLLMTEDAQSEGDGDGDGDVDDAWRLILRRRRYSMPRPRLERLSGAT